MLFDLLPKGERRRLRRHRPADAGAARGVRRLRESLREGFAAAACRPSVRSTSVPSSATPTPGAERRRGYFTRSPRRVGATERSPRSSPTRRRWPMRLRRPRRVPALGVAPARPEEGRRRPRGLLVGVPRLPRCRRRPRGDVRLGVEGVPRLEAELKAGASGSTPGRRHEVRRALDDDPRYQVTGTDGLQRWMQQLSDDAVEELGSRPTSRSPVRSARSTARSPRRVGTSAPTTPGRATTCPGRGRCGGRSSRAARTSRRGARSPSSTTRAFPAPPADRHGGLRAESLNDFQRLLAGTSGHAEGWALYAERLMRELGYLDDDRSCSACSTASCSVPPASSSTSACTSSWRSPAGTGFHEGERWTPELGLEFLLTRTVTDPALRRRDRPLPRLARPGAELQGRRAV